MSVHAVADYLLTKVDVEAGDAITNLKLQKLLYYCQGWYMAATGHALFAETIEAWREGPVAPAAYHRFKSFGRQSIPIEVAAHDRIAELSDEARKVIDQVWELYGDCSAWSLRDMTHGEPPWQQARQGLADNAHGGEIEAGAILAFFAAEQQRLLTQANLGVAPAESHAWATSLAAA